MFIAKLVFLVLEHFTGLPKGKKVALDVVTFMGSIFKD